MKYYKIVYGYEPDQYLPITADELHKAYVIAMEGGKTLFKAGFFENRGHDIMRIVEDWHTARGWNKGWKMTDEDYADILPFKEDYKKTLENGKVLAEYIVKENKRELLEIEASKAYLQVKNLLANSQNKPLLNEGSKKLASKFQV